MSSRRITLLASLLLAIALVAACSPGNTAPTITIQSPTEGATLFTTTNLAATASDAQDGNLTADIVWTSDVDGALTMTAGGAVDLSLGAHTLTASITDSGGLSASASVSVEVVEPRATHVVSEGLTLHLVYVEDGSLVAAGSASLPAAGLLPEHAIFNVIKHPSQPWLYAASMNDCSVGDAACWGNGRIDRFVIENDSLRHDGAAFLYDLDAVDVACAQAEVQVDYVGQVGYCSPNGMVFSPDDTRLYVDDDDHDWVQVFAVDAAGDLTFLAEGAKTSGHGLAIDATGSYLYNGTNIIDVTGAVPTEILPGAGGNATTVVDLGGYPGLITTDGTSAVVFYDLTDPVAPSLIDSADLGSNKVRDLGISSVNSVVAVGRDSVTTVMLAAGFFAVLDTYTATEAFTTEYRGVALTEDDSMAIAAWFRSDTFAGGAHLFSVGASGQLELIDAIDYSGRATTVVRVR